MASQSLPMPLSPARKQSRNRTATRTRSVRMVIAVFVALLILFSWLRLILALEIASTGRQIQEKTEERDKIIRSNNDKQFKISELMSPTSLSDAAYDKGFRPHKPIYVPLPQPFSGSTRVEGVDELEFPATDIDEQELPPEGQSLIDLATRELDTLLEVEVQP